MVKQFFDGIIICFIFVFINKFMATKQFRIHYGRTHLLVLDEEATSGSKGQWVLETHNPIVETIAELTGPWDLTRSGYRDKLIVASYPKLKGIPLIVGAPLEPEQLTTEAVQHCSEDWLFEEQTSIRETAARFFKSGYEANDKKFTLEQLETAINLARETEPVERKNNRNQKVRGWAYKYFNAKAMLPLLEPKHPVAVELQIETDEITNTTKVLTNEKGEVLVERWIHETE